MKTVALAKAQSLIQSFNGGIFGVTFVKKNGEIRTMAARTGTSKGINGRGNYSHTRDITRSNLTVRDMHLNKFRAIPLDRTVSIRFGGELYLITRA